MSARHKTIDPHTLNHVLASLSGSDEETYFNIREAIDFTLESAMPGGPDEDTLLDSAATLAKLHLNKRKEFIYLEHLDFRAESYDPLFLSAHVRAQLRKLTGTREAILLITGLRRMICPPGHYWTKKRQTRYDEAKHMIDDIAILMASKNTRMHLLYL